MSEPRITKRTAARILAVQVVYISIFLELEYNIDDIIAAQVEEDLMLDRHDETLLNTLLDNIKDNINHFDKIISQHTSEKWNIERLDKIILIIIRVAVCELIYNPSSETNLIIDEYTTIASYFIDERDINFVNAILEKISKEMRSNN